MIYILVRPEAVLDDVLKKVSAKADSDIFEAGVVVKRPGLQRRVVPFINAYEKANQVHTNQ